MIIRHNKKAILVYLVLYTAFTVFFYYAGWRFDFVPLTVVGCILTLLMILLVPFLAMCLLENHAIVIENGWAKFSPSYGNISFELNQITSVELEVRSGYMHQIKINLKDEKEWTASQKTFGRFYIWMNRKFARCTVVIASSMLDFNPFKLEEILKQEMKVME